MFVGAGTNAIARAERMSETVDVEIGAPRGRASRERKQTQRLVLDEPKEKKKWRRRACWRKWGGFQVDIEMAILKMVKILMKILELRCNLWHSL